jgi:hypothetical protein
MGMRAACGKGGGMRSGVVAGQRVVFQHQVPQPRVEDMGVDLGRGDIGMAQQRLDRAQIGAVLQQMRGEGVAQLCGVTARDRSRPGPRSP